MIRRHTWSAPIRFPLKSERTCLNDPPCGIVKVHVKPSKPSGYHRTEFYRGLDQIEGRGTPACDPVREDA
jgi:hypothetical protein